MVKDYRLYIKLIIDSCEKIEKYISGYDLLTFSNDGKTQSAVIMQLQIIGELSKKIPEDVKLKIDLPWKQIAGLRDWISHDYFSLNIEAIWKTINEEIVDLKKKIITLPL